MKKVTGCGRYHLDLVPFHLVVPIALVHRCLCSGTEQSVKVITCFSKWILNKYLPDKKISACARHTFLSLFF